jgi:hypothetical protein
LNIGIFGDSYASSNADHDSWWASLRDDHGHRVTSYGKGGSSIMYSALLLQQHHLDHDLNIWCLTAPGRISVPMGADNWFHSVFYWPEREGIKPIHDLELVRPYLDACKQYIKYLHDPSHEDLINRAIVTYFQQHVPNLLIVPCFYLPLKVDFNLYKLCEKELQVFFPTCEVHELYKKYTDIRKCHLSSTNNKILAHLVNQNLQSGIFSARYDQFCFDDIVLEDIIRPIK